MCGTAGIDLVHGAGLDAVAVDDAPASEGVALLDDAVVPMHLRRCEAVAASVRRPPTSSCYCRATARLNSADVEGSGSGVWH
jgi:hypothetical protein